MITPLIKKRICLSIALLIGLSSVSKAQSPLDNYIETGYKNNLVLQQKNISLEKAMYSLKSANALFLPSLSLKGDYQTGEGGRNIAIPIGDLLNPVYNTLNQLTASNSFPQVSNVQTNFLPNNYYDVKVRTTMPIINTDLIYNKQIQKQQLASQGYDVEIYKNELAKNIRLAYFNYLSASKAIAIYESALQLANEGKRINERLLANGKSIKAYVLRSESEIQNLLAKRSEALQQLNNAQLYFNFLINTEGNSMIDTTGVNEIDQTKIDNLLLSEANVKSRTELQLLEQSNAIYESMLKMNKASRAPKLNGFVDLGSQESDWKYSNESRYYFVGLQLDIPLFSFGKINYEVKKARLNYESQKLNSNFVGKQLQLSAEMAKNNLKTTNDNFHAAEKQLAAATSYFDLIEKGYREGMNTFIETVDARNQLTSASLQLVIQKYQLMSALANYQREIGK